VQYNETLDDDGEIDSDVESDLDSLYGETGQ
jgi:hypothetical protein